MMKERFRVFGNVEDIWSLENCPNSGSFVCVLYSYYTNSLEKQEVIIMVYF